MACWSGGTFLQCTVHRPEDVADLSLSRLAEVKNVSKRVGVIVLRNAPNSKSEQLIILEVLPQTSRSFNLLRTRMVANHFSFVFCPSELVATLYDLPAPFVDHPCFTTADSLVTAILKLFQAVSKKNDAQDGRAAVPSARVTPVRKARRADAKRRTPPRKREHAPESLDKVSGEYGIRARAKAEEVPRGVTSPNRKSAAGRPHRPAHPPPSSKDDEEEKVVPPRATSPIRTSPARRPHPPAHPPPTSKDDDEEEEDEEEEEVPPRATSPSRKGPAGRPPPPAHAPPTSEDDEEEEEIPPKATSPSRKGSARRPHPPAHPPRTLEDDEEEEAVPPRAMSPSRKGPAGPPPRRAHPPSILANFDFDPMSSPPPVDDHYDRRVSRRAPSGGNQHKTTTRPSADPPAEERKEAPRVRRKGPSESKTKIVNASKGDQGPTVPQGVSRQHKGSGQRMMSFAPRPPAVTEKHIGDLDEEVVAPKGAKPKLAFVMRALPKVPARRPQPPADPPPSADEFDLFSESLSKVGGGRNSERESEGLTTTVRVRPPSSGPERQGAPKPRRKPRSGDLTSRTIGKESGDQEPQMTRRRDAPSRTGGEGQDGKRVGPTEEDWLARYMFGPDAESLVTMVASQGDEERLFGEDVDQTDAHSGMNAQERARPSTQTPAGARPQPPERPDSGGRQAGKSSIASAFDLDDYYSPAGFALSQPHATARPDLTQSALYAQSTTGTVPETKHTVHETGDIWSDFVGSKAPIVPTTSKLAKTSGYFTVSGAGGSAESKTRTSSSTTAYSEPIADARSARKSSYASVLADSDSVPVVSSDLGHAVLEEEKTDSPTTTSGAYHGEVKVSPLSNHDSVSFDVYAPSSMAPNEDFGVDIWASVLSERKKMHEAATTGVNTGQTNRGGSRDLLPVDLGDKISLELRAPDFQFRGRSRAFFSWTGQTHCVKFLLSAPTSEVRDSTCSAVVSVNGLVLAHVAFSLCVSRTPRKTQKSTPLDSATRLFSRIAVCFDRRDHIEFLRYKFAMQSVSVASRVERYTAAVSGWDLFVLLWSSNSAGNEELQECYALVHGMYADKFAVLSVDPTAPALPDAIHSHLMETSSFFKRLLVQGSLDDVSGLLAVPQLVSSSPRGTVQPQALNVIRQVGEGSFGKAYLSTMNEQQVVVKKLDLSSVDAKAVEGLIYETVVMERVSGHENVVTFHGSCLSESGDELWLLSEFVSRGDLRSLIDDNSTAYDSILDSRAKLQIGADIAAGVAHLHAHNIVHRDLAARNVLLDEQFRAKVTDFGLSRVLPSKAGQVIKSDKLPIKWLPPESVQNCEFGEASDVWGIGVTILELWTGQEPYPDLSTREVLRGMLTGEIQKPELPMSIDDKVRTAIRPCFRLDPARRPTAQALYESFKALVPAELDFLL